MNRNLTCKIKEYAYDLGADLVGVAPIYRFENAPIMMSPQGIMPGATNVIVCAIHHPDEAIEMGGEQHPQILGPYTIQYAMNVKLDYIAYRIARMLDNLGYDAIPIACSNIWRYRPYADLKATFAPDMSHIYAATCAGLGQLGWHGLTMTPEYGPRNRFISVITDAPLCATKLYEDMKLCDMCGECIRHCPADAYTKECNGVKTIEVEGRVYRFANKNLWRCAWGEHFDLDLDLEIPDVVDEEVLTETIDKHGLRGGEMGCCLKYCLPKHLRIDGGEHTSTYIRKKHALATDLPVHRKLYDDVANFVRRYSVDNVEFLDEETVDSLGGKKIYEYARGAVVMSISCEKNTHSQGDKINARHGYGNESYGTISAEQTALAHFSGFARLDATRIIDGYGYTTLNSPESIVKSDAMNRKITTSDLDKTAYAKAAGIEHDDTKITIIEVLLSSAPFGRYEFYNLTEPVENIKKSLTQNLCDLIEEEGSDVYAIVPASRMDILAEKLESIKGGEELINTRSKTPRFHVFDPETTIVKRKILKISDHLKNAKNVIMMSMHYPEKVQKMTIKPPAYAVGPYMFSKYESSFELAYSSLKIVKYLNAKGYSAVATYNLTGIGGDMGTPRGLLPDAFCNQLEAVHAGIGRLTLNGMCYTHEHSFSQDFIAIVTDAPLEELVHARKGDMIECAGCDECIKACPSNALKAKNETEIELDGVTYR
ncbi:MAG: 4Fe-4S binding protein, partial [Clostridiales bacterium]|nr:4Fe-4S binding protein [Clostridiales bacterium]